MVGQGQAGRVWAYTYKMLLVSKIKPIPVGWGSFHLGAYTKFCIDIQWPEISL